MRKESEEMFVPDEFGGVSLTNAVNCVHAVKELREHVKAHCAKCEKHMSEMDQKPACKVFDDSCFCGMLPVIEILEQHEV